MKRIVILFLAALFAASGASAQKFHNAYYDTRRAAHDEEGLQQGAIVFLGNSITEQGWWSLLLKRGDVENRGIGGDNTFGMIDRLPDILKSKPRKIFLMAGINDLTGGQPVDTIVMNITRMADMVHEAVPGCRLYIQSVLPVNTRTQGAQSAGAGAQCAAGAVVRRQAVVYVRRSCAAAFRCRRRAAHRPDEGRNPPPSRGICDLDRLPQETEIPEIT